MAYPVLASPHILTVGVRPWLTWRLLHACKRVIPPKYLLNSAGAIIAASYLLCQKDHPYIKLAPKGQFVKQVIRLTFAPLLALAVPRKNHCISSGRKTRKREGLGLDGNCSCAGSIFTRVHLFRNVLTPIGLSRATHVLQNKGMTLVSAYSITSAL